jgi:hypothetical protein
MLIFVHWSAIFSSTVCTGEDRLEPGIADANALAPPSGRADRTLSAVSRAVAASFGNSPATKDKSLIVYSIES